MGKAAAKVNGLVYGSAKRIGPEEISASGGEGEGYSWRVAIRGVSAWSARSELRGLIGYVTCAHRGETDSGSTSL